MKPNGYQKESEDGCFCYRFTALVYNRKIKKVGLADVMRDLVDDARCLLSIDDDDADDVDVIAMELKLARN